jgi:hypothetical protein
MYYYLPEPPYFLLILGLLVGITSGVAFEALLKQKVNHWMKSYSTQSPEQLLGFNTLFSFWGICLGTCIFLASGLETFSLDRLFAYGFSLLMTIFIGGLVWKQLRTVLKDLKQGGSKALDLDDFT